MFESITSMRRSKAAASKAKDVAQVGLKRGGSPVIVQHKSKAHRAEALGGAVEAQGLKRGGKKEIASYSVQSDYGIGKRRVHDKPTSSGFFNSLHPGTTPGNTKRAERAKFARNTEWNGPKAQR